MASFLLCIIPTPSHGADPDPLQDFCPADLNAPIHVNGFPCKDPASVISENFFFTGFNTIDGREFDTFGLNITVGNVYTFSGLNTLGISQNRARILPGGLSQPRVHPRASKLTQIVEGTLLVGIITSDGYSIQELLGEERCLWCREAYFISNSILDLRLQQFLVLLTVKILGR
ncbi:OLC1v1003410C1 [Oldenlandia corymbosa var. corymbosa]|uniref:OLC1v1003410C1 n=1 Tax=Oldenlandia corymbosa var. corymbosa TaxID=529605 RepID=A0AAV1DB91_OLDCO|nr:OLC1v1003410C1 [Oldenlandia corymbosa var. corymbosa]